MLSSGRSAESSENTQPAPEVPTEIATTRSAVSLLLLSRSPVATTMLQHLVRQKLAATNVDADVGFSDAARDVPENTELPSSPAFGRYQQLLTLAASLRRDSGHVLALDTDPTSVRAAYQALLPVLVDEGTQPHTTLEFSSMDNALDTTVQRLSEDGGKNVLVIGSSEMITQHTSRLRGSDQTAFSFVEVTQQQQIDSLLTDIKQGDRDAVTELENVLQEITTTQPEAESDTSTASPLDVAEQAAHADQPITDVLLLDPELAAVNVQSEGIECTSLLDAYATQVVAELGENPGQGLTPEHQKVLEEQEALDHAESWKGRLEAKREALADLGKNPGKIPGAVMNVFDPNNPSGQVTSALGAGAATTMVLQNEIAAELATKTAAKLSELEVVAGLSADLGITLGALAVAAVATFLIANRDHDPETEGGAVKMLTFMPPAVMGVGGGMLLAAGSSMVTLSVWIGVALMLAAYYKIGAISRIAQDSITGTFGKMFPGISSVIAGKKTNTTEGNDQQPADADDLQKVLNTRQGGTKGIWGKLRSLWRREKKVKTKSVGPDGMAERQRDYIKAGAEAETFAEEGRKDSGDTTQSKRQRRGKFGSRSRT